MSNSSFNLPAGFARVLLATSLLLGATAASAQLAAVAGAGSRSCAQMQTDIAELPNVRRAYVSWMQGYLSGRNAARDSAGLALIDLADYEAQWQWLAGWCSEHSARSIADAVNALFVEREQQAQSDHG